MSSFGVPRYWREIKYRYRLIGSRCCNCGKIFFPHRSICRVCGGKKLEDYKLSEKGRVLTFTVIRRDPQTEYKSYLPYIVGIIEVENCIRLIHR